MLREADANPCVVAPNHPQIRAYSWLDGSRDDRPHEVKNIVVNRQSFPESPFVLVEDFASRCGGPGWIVSAARAPSSELIAA